MTIAVKDGVHIVDFCDPKIFELAAGSIQNRLLRLVDAEGTIRLLLNFKNVEHLSSAALGMLINVQKAVQQKDGKLILSDLRPRIYAVFQITTLNKMFNIYDTVEHAVTHF
ncbi:MAG: STAS domain-containing protein [Planctomycetota bacterium]|nr:STAS domain-containing protein [Planctomycetota bacterium]